mmetsp:Transcript_9965/g.21211  ORF Transcript_9965/g.21211 Transcript_9965/m.21211 type:complete len:111 (-) Transcript_9965:3-335(-)
MVSIAVATMAVTSFESGSASMLTRAIATDRRITFKDCMRRSAGGDETLNQVLQRASPVCRKGLQSFYCQRVAGVHDIRSSAPLENFCEARTAGHRAAQHAFRQSPALQLV